MPEMQQRSRILSTSTSSAPTAGSNNNLQPDPHEPSSIPPWVHVNDGNGEPEISLLLPANTKPNTRHYKPPTHYKPGRKWDHFRSAEPPLLSAPIADHQLRWVPFMQSGPNPPQMKEGRIASPSWMEENMPYTSTDWDPEDEVEPAPGLLSAKGLMYRGKWLISPQRQERTVRLFWVSCISLHLSWVFQTRRGGHYIGHTCQTSSDDRETAYSSSPGQSYGLVRNGGLHLLICFHRNYS